MIVFRLISFMTRLIASFFFVFLLQIPFNGQTLESYLNRFGQKFFVTKTLQKVSDNGARIIKEWNKDENPQREITNKKAREMMETLSQKIQQNYQNPPPEEEK